MLIELTRHSDPNTRLTAVYSLGNLEEHSTAQVEAIQAVLNDENSDVQLAAIKVLGQMGQPAKASLKPDGPAQFLDQGELVDLELLLSQPRFSHGPDSLAGPLLAQI